MVYDALIMQVHAYGGSVIGFAGDAITCWFDEADEQPSMRATACGLALQKAMQPFDRLALPEGQTVTLALKVAIASGPARRFLVGRPDIQLLDVLAGETVTRMAIAEQLAQKGEVLVDAATIGQVPDLEVLAWRRGHDRDEPFAVISASELSGHTAKSSAYPSLKDEEYLHSWLLPAVYKRLQAGLGEFLTELRPAVALFLRFCCLYLDSSEAGRQLVRYISWVQGVVQRYEGTLTQLTIGDKGSYLSVLFGAPVAHEDDARRAVAVALELRTPPAELSFIQTPQIGISLGMMRTGAYGGTMRRTYGVLGDQVNLAARLMTHAKAAQILVSPSAQRAAAPYFTWHALPAIHVKGKSESISPFEVLAIRQAVGLHQATSTLPIVGRKEELQQICAKLELAKAKAKKGQIVGITGEAGIGKSRLVAEVIEFALKQGYQVYAGECQSYATKSPYLVWQPLWRALFGLSPGTSTSEQVKQLQNELTRISPSLLPRLPLLRDVLNLPIPDNELTSSFDAKLRKESREATRSRGTVNSDEDGLYGL
jgi:class 3 adenylate cyclase